MSLWTESAEPLPRPPLAEFSNEAALSTITSNLHLFKVSTPINVDRFENLLTIARVWPWADTQVPSPIPKTEAERDFIQAQISKEETVGRYSPTFGRDLLPGMYSMPIHAVPKEGGKFHLVTNHSAGEYSLNSMIAKEDIAGVTLDNVQDLGEAINEYRRYHPCDVLQIWKADVSEAYWHMSMHPLWKIKQIVTFEANVFGGRASQRIFHAFMSLVIWIAAFIYVDNSFSFAKLGDLSYYVKYRKMFPSEMVTLLLLWDELGIPHEEYKQIFGSPLPVIGFDVDPNLMRISLKNDSKLSLVRELCEFARYKSKQTLRDFEHIAGSLNWALNICPLLRPGLSAVYAKIKGKSNAKVYCDASGSGMGFWYPSLNLAFQSNLPNRPPSNDIFFSEALCVTLAIHDAVTRLPKDGHLAVFTDSLNTVYMFNSLSRSSGYNHLLMDMVETVLVFEVDFRVFHISGCGNTVADHLSRWRARDAPPRNALGVVRK
ncbi:hypothetical protein P692DRAFT_201842064 [Suillus brevipes Sb2]|nr:hypothetical protein P692DRAFT_201842064 [Suillus brevipes Sb2]